MPAELLTEYDATLDAKKRFIVRGLPTFSHFHVRVFHDRAAKCYTVKMEPRVLASMDQLSRKTLKMMDRAMARFAKGAVSEPIDIKKLKEMSDGLPD